MRVAIVVGGSSGIGEACVVRYLQEDYRVVVMDVDSERGAALAAKEGDRVSFVRCDVSDSAQVERAFADVRQSFGGVATSYALVNSAAVFVFGKVEDSDAAQWRRILDVNVVGTAMCCKHFVATLAAPEGSSIVNISSISAFVAQNAFVPYATTKAAVLGMTRNLALDCAARGIRVNSVSPGTIDTPATRAAIASFSIPWADFLAAESKLHILNRIGLASEVANAVFFLTSDQASFITASNLMVDGGYVAK